MARKVKPLLERVMARVLPTDSGCLAWGGASTHNGYGLVTRGDGKMVYVHREVYELLVGAVPPGFEVDHLCGNRLCCMTGHLEAVTPQVNSRRRSGWTHVDGAWFCRAGHLQGPWQYTKRNGGVECRECRNSGKRRRYKELAVERLKG